LGTVNQVLPSGAAFSVQRSAFRNASYPLLAQQKRFALTIEKLCGREAGRAPPHYFQKCRAKNYFFAPYYQNTKSHSKTGQISLRL
jgi:hypothetical protein